MSTAKDLSLADIGKLVAIAGVSVGINHLLSSWLNRKNCTSKGQYNRGVVLDLKVRREKSMREKGLEPLCADRKAWSEFELNPGRDDLLVEIDMMTRIVCPFVKVNNLIVDLELKDFETRPCPLVASKNRMHKNEGFLFPQGLVQPGTFVIQNCMFRAGDSIETEKKFLRAGPRSTQFFCSKEVRADIVVIGKAAPGINTLIRELVYLLKDTYEVERVTGVRFGFKGYLDDSITDPLVDLTPKNIETIHHKGGCFLGLSKRTANAAKIVENLVQRDVNQLYLIGGNDTCREAIEIYRQIRRRKLKIAISVCLKAINKDIAYIDTCFGFESAVEATQNFIQQGYALCKSTFNSVSLIKVPGRFSGFLAMDTVRAARNAHACLVPQFPFDLYGQRGLLRYIADRVKLKGHCIIVYSEGASFAVRDIDEATRNRLSNDEFAFDLFLKQQISQELTRNKLEPNSVFFTDTQNAVRSVPANAFDTKLCCQIAICSIQGLMCGYTNFGIGHLRNRVAMIPLEDIDRGEKFHLKASDENWQRLLATTGQPSFLNDQHIVAEP